MAKYENKTIGDIFKNLNAKYTALRAKYKDTTPLLEKAVVKSIFYAFSAALGSIWQQSVWIYKQCFPQTCGLDALKFWGNLIGIEYRYGASANLSLKLTNVTAEKLSAGTVYKDLNSGLIYKTISQVAAENGEIKVMAECTTPGVLGNIAIDTELNIANPLDGIPSTAQVTAVVIEGTEDEEIEDYRRRVLIKYRSKSQGGSAIDYYNWAMEVPGVSDVFPYTLEEGLVTLFIVASGSGQNRTPGGWVTPNPFPEWINGEFTDYEGSGLLFSVAKSIEGSGENMHDRRPMCACVKLLPPNYTGFSVTITGLTSMVYNEDIKEALINALDLKRPHIKVLGYTESDAKINSLALATEVYKVIGTETFTTFVLKDSSGNTIDEINLGIGCLAYLSELTINGVNINL